MPVAAAPESPQHCSSPRRRSDPAIGRAPAAPDQGPASPPPPVALPPSSRGWHLPRPARCALACRPLGPVAVSARRRSVAHRPLLFRLEIWEFSASLPPSNWGTWHREWCPAHRIRPPVQWRADAASRPPPGLTVPRAMLPRPPDNRDGFAGPAHRHFATRFREEGDRERDSPGGTSVLPATQSRAPERCAAFPDRSAPRSAPPAEPVTVPAPAGYRCWAQALPSPGPPPIGRAPGRSLVRSEEHTSE